MSEETTERKCISNRAKIAYCKGYSKPTQTKPKNKPQKDQTDLQLMGLPKQNSTVFKRRKQNPDT